MPQIWHPEIDMKHCFIQWSTLQAELLMPRDKRNSLHNIEVHKRIQATNLRWGCKGKEYLQLLRQTTFPPLEDLTLLDIQRLDPCVLTGWVDFNEVAGLDKHLALLLREQLT